MEVVRESCSNNVRVKFLVPQPFSVVTVAKTMTACADISLSVSQDIHFSESCGSLCTMRKNVEINKKLSGIKAELKVS